MPQMDPTSFPPQVVWLLITFIVLFVVMSKVAVPKIADALEARQRRINDNRSLPNSPGSARCGSALLSGLIVCGRCQRHMQAEYHAEKIKRPQYRCRSLFQEEDDQPCHSFKASPVDELVAQQVLRALEPAALDLSMQATMDIQRERERLHQHWRQRLERVTYDTQRAERQYQSVEPENRLVARTLEQHWEQSLHQERELREEHHRFLAETPGMCQ